VLALSTSCLPPGPEGLDERITRLLDHEVEGYELSYRIAEEEIERFGREIRAVGRSVVSLHSYCPVPSGIRPREAGGDLLLLTSEDESLRREGIRATIRTLEWAARLEARAIVMHSGRTPIDYPKHEIRKLHDSGRWIGGANAGSGDEALGILRRVTEQLAETAPRTLDLLKRSLDPILEAASRLEVMVGLENRIYPHEHPNAAEFPILLETFAGAPIGTWYDTGHSCYREILGFVFPGSTWKAMLPHLLGCHVHDVQGIQDHLPPGEGSLDFADLLSDAPEEIPLVVECRADQSAERIAAGISFLEASLAGGDEKTPTDPFALA